MKTIWFVFFLGLSNALSAQGNLQFNKVKLVSSVDTVTYGKVWKVESAAYNGGEPFSNSTTWSNYTGSGNVIRGFEGIMKFIVNGNTIIIASNLSISNIYLSSVNNYIFPMWLPAGTTLEASTNVVYLNVIEFNIIP
jgi:hypothetical protein